jgi:hypothetical protein
MSFRRVTATARTDTYKPTPNGRPLPSRRPLAVLRHAPLRRPSPMPTSRSQRRCRSASHRSESTPQALPPSDLITVTLPVHPFRGRQLVLIRSTVSADGRRYVQVEGPKREVIVLPEEWTDRGAPVAPPRVGGREVLLSARGLVELARTVADTLDRGPRQPQISPQPTFNPPSGPVDASASDRSTRSTSAGHAAGQRAPRPAGRVGDTPAQDGTGRRGRGGRP